MRQENLKVNQPGLGLEDSSPRQDANAAKPAGKAAAKSASAFRTISEVADELGVQQHVLRFWESKFTQVKPLKRGGGRRYYRPEDVELLRKIHSLLYKEGYTIKGVQRLLQKSRGAAVAAPAASEAKAAPASSSAAAAADPTKSPAWVAAHRRELKGLLDELKALRELLD